MTHRGTIAAVIDGGVADGGAADAGGWPSRPSPSVPRSSTLTVRRSRLVGEVRVGGAKNSALPAMAATLLTKEPVVIENFPASLLDVTTMADMMRALGKRVTVSHDTAQFRQTAPPTHLRSWTGRSVRYTLLLLGALLARNGYGEVPLPGGCQLGNRKFDIHEMVFRQLGAKVRDDGERLIAEAERGLAGCDIVLPIRSTGATENALICASLARGTTRIWNPHVRPEVIDLVCLLRGMGASIEVHGQESIIVHGQSSLGGTRFRLIPDNLEAISWLIAAMATSGEIAIENFPARDLEVPLIFLRESGARFTIADRVLHVGGGAIYPLDISTGAYPGINSDMQPLFAVVAACAKGVSRIVDLRFPNRFRYATEFGKMGMVHEIRDNCLVIQGGRPVHGARVRATDLRAGMALTLLGLTADGETMIDDAWQIDRGYADLVGKLRHLGADISAGA